MIVPGLTPVEFRVMEPLKSCTALEAVLAEESKYASQVSAFVMLHKDSKS